MNNMEALDMSLSNLQIIMYWLVPAITLIAAFVCLAISKDHIYRVALRLSSISLFFIAVAWAIPLSAGTIIENYIFNFETEYEAFGEALAFANGLTAVLFILGHVLLAVSFYKFRDTKV